MGSKGLMFPLCGLLLSCSTASAAILLPGGSVFFPHDHPFSPPPGELVAEDVRPLAVTWVAPPGMAFHESEDPTGEAEYVSRVFRDPADGRLSFYYEIRIIRGHLLDIGREYTQTTIDSFGSFTTDVDGWSAGSTHVVVDRSADGGTLLINSGGQGIGGPPILAVATDAGAFDSNGSLTFVGRDEFLFDVLNDPGYTTLSHGTATITIPDAFQPVVPEPAAAAIMLLAALGRTARRCRRVCGFAANVDLRVTAGEAAPTVPA